MTAVSWYSAPGTQTPPSPSPRCGMAANAPPQAAPAFAAPNNAHPGAQPKPNVFSATIPFASEADARAVVNAVAVDAELRTEQVSRELTVDGHKVVIKFEATEARLLRAATGTLLELLSLAAATLERFRP
ncbi:unnamed protein product [Ostreobium quekettii]|uniref:Uncharacterized protein n=1 Tax=Ostreobium quekettii TaxID=121088 RepID=A0A8S1J532_9CHLO|nr:unnamed protein product [Ostreobium quekettii]|eukprot:evm.model.scf_1451.1 EVM.evm.TU.scf_1451.1   scf_1451:1402-2275(+)